MAAGREILKTIDEEGLQEKARIISEYFLGGMAYLEDKYECVGNIRGHGLMMGMEIVTDKESKNPAPQLFGDIWEMTKDLGVLFGKGGRYGTVFRIQPSMALTHADVDFAIEILDHSIGECMAKHNM
jgi:alanine-glyoxylate transaminase / (R)-3-amino-2-methylpropionate-pyruvate transaminase